MVTLITRRSEFIDVDIRKCRMVLIDRDDVYLIYPGAYETCIIPLDMEAICEYENVEMVRSDRTDKVEYIFKGR